MPSFSRSVLFIALFVAADVFVAANPLNGLEELPSSDVDLKELEMRLNPEGIEGACKSNDSAGRVVGLSGNSQQSSRWKSGYNVQLDTRWNKDEATLIQGALKQLGSKFCVPIKQFPTGGTATGDYVFIQKGGANTGCYSNSIGRLGGRQIINLEVPGCMSKGIIMHENIHALGFNHEQTRTDRDKHITVFEKEIQPQARGNYKVYANSLTFGIPYDFKSIMHYGSSDFAVGRKPTMTKKDGSLIQKQRNDLTSSDQAKLKKMYNCP